MSKSMKKAYPKTRRLSNRPPDDEVLTTAEWWFLISAIGAALEKIEGKRVVRRVLEGAVVRPREDREVAV